MTIEQKAKAYDEAIEKIKYVMEHGVSPVLNKEDLQDIFPELTESEDEKIRKDVKRAISVALDYSYFDKETANNCLTWLEKQGEKPKKVSIWKHWKDGIAGGAADEQVFLIKIGRLYSISSCLGCECDYIELSELDKLMRDEKQIPKPKWSENDEHHWMMCLECVEECATQEREDFSKTIDWLKSIKKAMEE